jgi:hypothetical protein
MNDLPALPTSYDGDGFELCSMPAHVEGSRATYMSFKKDSFYLALRRRHLLPVPNTLLSLPPNPG